MCNQALDLPKNNSLRADLEKQKDELITYLDEYLVCKFQALCVLQEAVQLNLPYVDA